MLEYWFYLGILCHCLCTAGQIVWEFIYFRWMLVITEGHKWLSEYVQILTNRFLNAYIYKKKKDLTSESFFIPIVVNWKCHMKKNNYLDITPHKGIISGANSSVFHTTNIRKKIILCSTSHKWLRSLLKREREKKISTLKLVRLKHFMHIQIGKLNSELHTAFQ